MDRFFGVQAEELDDQMNETFRQLAPMFRPYLEAPPGAKRHRGPNQPQGAQESDPGHPGKQLLLMMGKILLAHERDLHNLRSQDSFILFLNHDEGGSLYILIKEAAKWRQQAENQQETRTLRSFLLQKLMEELKNRLKQVTHPTEGQKLRQVLEEKNFLYKDQSWPYLTWNGQQMIPNPKKPSLPMDQLTKLVDEVLDQVSLGNTVEKFQALSPLTEEYRRTHQVTPWRLQVGLRDNDLYNLFWKLSQSACWHLIGVQLKPHSQTLGGPARQLQTMMGLAPKGKGKGKGKVKAPTTPLPPK